MRRRHVEGRKAKERKGKVAPAVTFNSLFNSPSFYPLIPLLLLFRGGECLLGLKSRAATRTRNSPCNWPIMKQSDFQPWLYLTLKLCSLSLFHSLSLSFWYLSICLSNSPLTRVCRTKRVPWIFTVHSRSRFEETEAPRSCCYLPHEFSSGQRTNVDYPLMA